MTRLPILALVVALSACRTTPDATTATAASASATDAPASPAEQLISRDPSALVVDVRTPGEYASGHVAGARNVDVTGDGFAEAFVSIPKDQTVYVYCRSGSRSTRAKGILEEMGFQSVVNAGGFSDLAAAGAETE